MRAPASDASTTGSATSTRWRDSKPPDSSTRSDVSQPVMPPPPSTKGSPRHSESRLESRRSRRRRVAKGNATSTNGDLPSPQHPRDVGLPAAPTFLSWTGCPQSAARREGSASAWERAYRPGTSGSHELASGAIRAAGERRTTQEVTARILEDVDDATSTLAKLIERRARAEARVSEPREPESHGQWLGRVLRERRADVGGAGF